MFRCASINGISAFVDTYIKVNQRTIHVGSADLVFCIADRLKAASWGSYPNLFQVIKLVGGLRLNLIYVLSCSTSRMKNKISVWKQQRFISLYLSHYYKLVYVLATSCLDELSLSALAKRHEHSVLQEPLRFQSDSVYLSMGIAAFKNHVSNKSVFLLFLLQSGLRPNAVYCTLELC